jgi:hypothetical protein
VSTALQATGITLTVADAAASAYPKGMPHRLTPATPFDPRMLPGVPQPSNVKIARQRWNAQARVLGTAGRVFAGTGIIVDLSLMTTADNTLARTHYGVNAALGGVALVLATNPVTAPGAVVIGVYLVGDTVVSLWDDNGLWSLAQ